MEKTFELELRQSEARQELADLLERTPTTKRSGRSMWICGHLTARSWATRSLIPNLRSRVVKGSPEARELRQLMDKSNVGEIFDAALGKRAVDGASAEIQKHYGLDVNQVPLAMLVKDWPGDDDLEKRAVTPAPGNVGQEQNSIVPYVFPQSAAAFLGVVMPTVPVGEAVYPVLTKKLDVGTPAENAEQDETTGSFSADVLSPSVSRLHSSTAEKTGRVSRVWMRRFVRT